MLATLIATFPGSGPPPGNPGPPGGGGGGGQVPEIGLSAAAGAITLLIGFTLIMFDRSRRRQAV